MNTSKTEKKPKRLKTLQAAALKFMASTNRPTAQKVADNYGISLRTAKRIIAFLQASGFIARRGNNRSGEYIFIKQEEFIYE